MTGMRMDGMNGWRGRQSERFRWTKRRRSESDVRLRRRRIARERGERRVSRWGSRPDVVPKTRRVANVSGHSPVGVRLNGGRVAFTRRSRTARLSPKRNWDSGPPPARRNASLRCRARAAPFRMKRVLKEDQRPGKLAVLLRAALSYQRYVTSVVRVC